MTRSSPAGVGEYSWLMPPLQPQISAPSPGKNTYGPGEPPPVVSRHNPDCPLTSSPVPPVPDPGTAETRLTPPAATVVVNVPDDVPSDAPLHRSVRLAGPASPSWARDTLNV